MSNNTQTFHAFCEERGILPPRDIVPGKWIDCPTVSHPRKKKGRVKLSDNGRIGFAMDWVTMVEFAVWRADCVANPTIRSEEENARLSEALALRRSEEKAAIMRANSIFAKSKPLRGGTHPYMLKKHMSMAGLRHLRVDSEGWIVVPICRDDSLISCQRISPDGDKRFVAGAPVKYGTVELWRPGHLATILCEGVATAQTVFEACPIARVIACFSASNLIEVAKRGDWSGMVAVAGDDDADTFERIGKNPGRDAATEAAKAIGCGAAFPTTISDFNDMLAERLATLEKQNGERSFPAYPQELRRSAMAPINALVMQAMKKV